jgi:hypothetical protein
MTNGLATLLQQTAADELMLTTVVYDRADRVRSYELVASEVIPKLQATRSQST